jgi:hypothetical protein
MPLVEVGPPRAEDQEVSPGEEPDLSVLSPADRIVHEDGSYTVVLTNEILLIGDGSYTCPKGNGYQSKIYIYSAYPPGPATFDEEFTNTETETAVELCTALEGCMDDLMSEPDGVGVWIQADPYLLEVVWLRRVNRGI